MVVSADSPLVGMTLGEAEALHDAPLMLALQTGTDTRLAPPADMRIWVGSVLGVMGARQEVADFAQNHFLRLSSRLRHFGDLFNPSRAGISEAVIPPTSRYIGKTAATSPAQAVGHQPAGDQPRQEGAARRTCARCRCAPATCWCSTASGRTWRAAANRDFVVVTDYPKGEQRPHKFKIAMTIFAITILIALTSKLPGLDRPDDRRGRHAADRRAAHGRGLRAINWKTVFLMAGLIPLGWAMDSSGAAAWVAGHTVERLPEGIPIWVLELAVALLTTLFSLVISHVGATIVMVPMAINLALAAGGNPTAFALIVALSASNNLMTASNPVMSMITGPANYTSGTVARRRTVVADLSGGRGVDDQCDVLTIHAVGSPRSRPLFASAHPARMPVARGCAPAKERRAPEHHLAVATSTATARSESPRHGPATHSPRAIRS